MKSIKLGKSFSYIRSNHGLFVDKSLWIRDVLQSSAEVMLVTRPRRFGKTFNLKMLRDFLSLTNPEEARALFQGTLVESALLLDGTACTEHLAQYPVIFLSMKDLRAKDFDTMQLKFHDAIAMLYSEYSYLLESSSLGDHDRTMMNRVINRSASQLEYEVSLQRLISWLHQHHQQRVYVLIDEYDTPAHEAYVESEDFLESWLAFMQGWLGRALKDNEQLQGAVLTGILKVSIYNLFSGINNLVMDSLVDPISPEAFGFTQSEVQHLLENTHMMDKETDFKKWFNGYRVGGHTLYNPWSTLQSIFRHGKMDSYWVSSGDRSTLAKAIMKCADPRLLQGFVSLMDGQDITVEIDERTLFYRLGQRSESVWGLLLFSGYLSADEVYFEGARRLLRIRIPNQEVMFEMEQVIRSWIRTDQDEATSETFIEALEITLSQADLTPFLTHIRHYLLETASYYDLSQKVEEKFYHVFLLGLMMCFKDSHMIQSNRESGHGRFDLALIPKSSKQRGMILEMKIAETSESLEQEADVALAQIASHHYNAMMRQHGVLQWLQVGLSFYGKEVAGKHQLVNQ